MFFFTTIKIQLTRRRGVEAAGASSWGPAACSGSPAPPAPRVPSLPLRRLVLARNDDEGGQVAQEGLQVAQGAALLCSVDSVTANPGVTATLRLIKALS
jgi:hypothetical protein